MFPRWSLPSPMKLLGLTTLLCLDWPVENGSSRLVVARSVSVQTRATMDQGYLPIIDLMCVRRWSPSILCLVVMKGLSKSLTGRGTARCGRASGNRCDFACCRHFLRTCIAYLACKIARCSMIKLDHLVLGFSWVSFYSSLA
jgi:hypothetical protein